MIFGLNETWAGTESSLLTAEKAEDRVIERQAGMTTSPAQEEDQSRLLSISDGLAVIAVKGPLVNSDSPYLQYFGVTGYPEIRTALVEAAQDPDVKQIMLEIDSGGGAVSGVSDTANLIRMIHKQVKPVTAFTDGSMMSAAYWLGSSAGKVMIGKSAQVGSIGVIAVHKEYSAQLKAEGVGVNVIRAGKYKALANSVEPLSEAGKAQIQASVDDAYKVFVEHIAEARGKTYAYADTHMAQGQEFGAEAAVTAGLADKVTTFDAVVGDLKKKAVDASSRNVDNRGKSTTLLHGEVEQLSGEQDMVVKKALTEADIAILAAGGTLEAAAPTPEELETARLAAEAKAKADAEAAAATAVSTQNLDKLNATVQLLNEQVATKDAAILAAGVKTAQLEDALVKLAASTAQLTGLARESVNTMRVALGMSALDLSAMDAAKVLAEHDALVPTYKAKFPVGGVAAVSAEASTRKSSAPVSDAAHMARVNAARFSDIK